MYEADVFISGADYAHTEKLLNGNRNYSEEYWQKKTFAPSSFLYYVAFNRKVNHLCIIICSLIQILKRMQKKFMIPKNYQNNLCFMLIFRAKQMILFVKSRDGRLIPVAEYWQKKHEKEIFQLIPIKNTNGELTIVFKIILSVKEFSKSVIILAEAHGLWFMKILYC